MKIDTFDIIVGNATDVGKIRECNEDYLSHFVTTYGYCIIVCDGMGGHAAGDVASQGAIEAIKHYLQDGKVTKLDTPNSLLNAIEFANYKLRETVQQNPALTGMGTTCVMALIYDAEMFVAHAGDSRIYLIRDHSIKQLSKDHSTIQNLIDAGVLTEAEAKVSEKRNQITKAIGIFEKVEPTVTKEAFQLKNNDRILLCSDGLTAHVSDEEILEIINANTDVQIASLELIEKANNGGGSDNITVQLIQYIGKSSIARKKRPIKKMLRLGIITLIVAVLGYVIYNKFMPSRNEKTVPNSSQGKTDTIPGDTTNSGIIGGEEKMPASKNQDKVKNGGNINKHNSAIDTLKQKPPK
ncbi:MAG: Stp1/IreP family PP2C-type Ser/Thr phosphatase [Bacteroidales bacterium]|nr:Stp1/IreP family PP2C-type Ser/Thr phosphatase [Bacteroidales bacterium]